MSAVSPTEIANKAKAIRRHDCRRGKQDCLLHGFGCGLPRYGVRLSSLQPGFSSDVTQVPEAFLAYSAESKRMSLPFTKSKT